MFRNFIYFVAIGMAIAKFPSHIEKCHYDDEECIIKVSNHILANYPLGIPEINLASIDPLKIDFVNIAKDSGSFKLSLTYKNASLLGLQDAKFKSMKNFKKNPTENQIELQLRIPSLSLVGKYTAKGKVLLLEIDGNGYSNITEKNVDVKMKFSLSPVLRNNKEYMAIDQDKFKLSFETTRLYSQFTNLFKGNDELNANLHVYLDNNWQDLLNELKPAITDTFQQVIASVLGSVFLKVPYADMFLED